VWRVEREGVRRKREWDAVGVAVGGGGSGGIDELTVEGVQKAMRVDLLAYPVGGLGTERGLVDLVALDLPGDKLDLPALAVEDGKLLGRGRHRVEQVGDQPVELGMTLAPV